MYAKIKQNTLRLTILLGILITIISPSISYAISQSALNSIINNRPFYSPTECSTSSTSTLSPGATLELSYTEPSPNTGSLGITVYTPSDSSPHPLVVFAPGRFADSKTSGTFPGGMYAQYLQATANQGFIVAGLNYPDNTGAANAAGQQQPRYVVDTKFAITQLLSESQLQGKINTDAGVGLIGHSDGGQIAMSAASSDPTVKALIAENGYTGASESMPTLFLDGNGDGNDPTSSYNNSASSYAAVVTMLGADHFNYLTTAQYAAAGGEPDGTKYNTASNMVTGAFLKRFLSSDGSSGTKLSGVVSQYGSLASIQEKGTDTPAGSSSSTSSSSTTSSATTSVSNTFILGFDVSTPKDTIEAVIKKYHPAGIVPLGTNDAGSVWTKDFISQLNQDNGKPLIVASDEEGGAIYRYAHSPTIPSPTAMSGMTNDQVTALGKQVGTDLVNAGVTTDLAPVLDVSTKADGTDATTVGRAFSTDPSVVADKAGAFAAGLASAGIKPVYKHFPGIGSQPDANTDQSKVSTSSLNDLKNKDLKPYETLLSKNGAAVMLSNASTPGLTEAGKVASTSAATVGLLRNDYKFSGLIMTDALEALGPGKQGLKPSLSASIVAALQAGVDAPLFTYTNDADLDAAIQGATAAKIDISAALGHIAAFTGQSTQQTTQDQCCDDGSGGSASQIPGSDNEAKVWNFFASKGLSTTTVAAIMGNMWAESGYNPIAMYPGTTSTSPETATTAWGLSQWLPASKFLNRIPQSGVTGDKLSLIFQLNFVWWELSSGNGPSGHFDLAKFKAMTDIGEATHYYHGVYEGSLGQNDAGRLTKAKELIQKYSNSPITPIAGSSSSSSCGGGSGQVPNGDSKALAQQLLDFKKDGKYNCDNAGDCTDLQKVIDGQSLAGSSGCKATTIDPRVLQILIYLINNGFTIGTYALCGDHSYDSDHGHSGGFAVDISTINGIAVNQSAAKDNTLKLDKFLHTVPKEIFPRQIISDGVGNHEDLDLLNESLYTKSDGTVVTNNPTEMVKFYGQPTLNEHQNHVHVGY